MKEWVKSLCMSFLQTLVDLPRILFSISKNGLFENDLLLDSSANFQYKY